MNTTIKRTLHLILLAITLLSSQPLSFGAEAEAENTWSSLSPYEMIERFPFLQVPLTNLFSGMVAGCAAEPGYRGCGLGALSGVIIGFADEFQVYLDDSCSRDFSVGVAGAAILSSATALSPASLIVGFVGGVMLSRGMLGDITEYNGLFQNLICAFSLSCFHHEEPEIVCVESVIDSYLKVIGALGVGVAVETMDNILTTIM